MHGIFTYIHYGHPKNGSNAGRYAIHGESGIDYKIGHALEAQSNVTFFFGWLTITSKRPWATQGILRWATHWVLRWAITKWLETVYSRSKYTIWGTNRRAILHHVSKLPTVARLTQKKVQYHESLSKQVLHF